MKNALYYFYKVLTFLVPIMLLISLSVPKGSLKSVLQIITVILLIIELFIMFFTKVNINNKD